ncbi:YaaC family protein [Gilvimarinus sp. SDUM040013]|uniref:YaaC family protein n=1 Tax=Gilvimarinus gilvus TaxID=3058038 RepID=A0ABU4S4X4_9GAMM|nr:YaaC family protein [Gilvimarinus sp. SDUM040013]MDO3385353.1 YaaC family protein [Gilvimarinus sp. SDUM040013]MDX6850928.1 YaaC family protein [Gilvimarinus sp. SDUM040013]
MDWYDIKFLESPTNLKSVLNESTGRTPNTNVAIGISTCLQQGRFFFEAAENSPLGIRPLQVFYGVVSFSKAIAAARNGSSISALSQAHGLKDISLADSLLENLTVKVQQRGTFQDVNDAVCSLESINYFGDENERLKIFKPTVQSNALCGKELTFKEITSRLPSLSKLYEKTFRENPNNQFISFYHRNGGLVDLRLDLPEYFHCRETLVEMVTSLREKYPFLNQWLLLSAQRCWDSSIIQFQNENPEGINEFSEDTLVEIEGRFEQRGVNAAIIPFDAILPPLSGGVEDGHQSYIHPIDGHDVSEYSILYMGIFLLSSLVRYRPEIWMHAVNGRSTNQRGHDDHCMALIESLLGNTLSSYPHYVKKCLETSLIG